SRSSRCRTGLQPANSELRQGRAVRPASRGHPAESLTVSSREYRRDARFAIAEARSGAARESDSDRAISPPGMPIQTTVFVPEVRAGTYGYQRGRSVLWRGVRRRRGTIRNNVRFVICNLQKRSRRALVRARPSRGWSRIEPE